MHGDDVAGDLRADQHRPGVDERIIGAFVVTFMQIIGEATDRPDDDQPAANEDGKRVLA